MSEPITPHQLAVLKNRIVWMAVGSPPEKFVEWWNKQSTQKMEEAIKKLTKLRAISLVQAAIFGDYSKVKRKMDCLLKGGELPEE